MPEHTFKSYDPFTRGPFPVGVRTIELRDQSRGGRALTVEVWYPASKRYRGQDLDDATRDRFVVAPGMPEWTQDAVRHADAAAGRFPLVVHNHGAFGYRTVASTLCTHLASHGYIVASNDVPGNTLADMINDVVRQSAGLPPVAFPVPQVLRHRWADASFIIESLIGGADPFLDDRINGTRVGACGQSAGGWTTLGLNSVNSRMAASFAMEPLWGRRSPLGLAEMASWLRLHDWGRPVPTFLLAGQLDTMIILEDLRELYVKLPAPKRFASLRGAGHFHFNDNAAFGHEGFRRQYMTEFPDSSFDAHALGVAMRPFSELCPAEHAADAMRGLCLALMDAHVKDDARALAFLDGDLTATYKARGIDLDEVASEPLARSMAV